MKPIVIFILLLATICYSDPPVQEQRMGYTENIPWEKKNGKGYDGFYKVALKQDPSKPVKTAEWAVDLPKAGHRYAVYATWVADKANSRMASYDIFDGEAPGSSVNVNQQEPPRGKLIKETYFKRLGAFYFTSRVIRIVLSSQTDGNVISDSVLVVPE